MVGGAYIVRHPPHVSRVLLRLGGTGLAVLLVQELGRSHAVAEPEGIDPARRIHPAGTVRSALGTERAEAVQPWPGTARGIARVRGAGPVAGIGLREAGRGIGRFAAGLSSFGCS